MRLVLLDRDGVINQDRDQFIKAPEEWVPIPGSLEAIARLCRADYRVVVITNQSGIARGLLSMETLNRIHTRMLERIHQKGGEVDVILFCPHGPKYGCQCRKPKAGLFLELADRLKIKLDDVPAVGDSSRDLQAARAARCLPVLVKTGEGTKTVLSLKASDGLNDVPVFDDLAAFANDLIYGALGEQLKHPSKNALFPR